MWTVLLALALSAAAEVPAPCSQPPVVTLSVRPFAFSPPPPPEGSQILVILSGSVAQPRSCFLVGATYQAQGPGGFGASGPLPIGAGTFSQVVTIPVPPQAGALALSFVVTVVNEAGPGRSRPAGLLLPGP